MLITVLVYDPAPVKCFATALAKLPQQTRSVRYETEDGYQMTGLVHVHNPTRGDCIFGNRINPLAVYDDLGFSQRFRFPHRELLEVTDEFNDDLQYLASTKRSLLPTVFSWPEL